jgi:hypothetical protein
MLHESPITQFCAVDKVAWSMKVVGEMASRVENRRSDCSLPVDIWLGFRRATSVRFGLVLFPVAE